MTIKPTIDNIALAALIFAVVAISAVSAVALTSAGSLLATNEKVLRTHRALMTLDAIRFQSMAVQASEASYVITGRERDLTAFQGSVIALENELATLSGEHSEFAFVKDNVNDITTAARALVAHEQNAVTAYQALSPTGVRSLVATDLHSAVHDDLLAATQSAAIQARQWLGTLEKEQKRIGEWVWRWILALISSSAFILIFLYGSLRKLHIEQRDAQDKFAHQATHDALTGLYNRPAVMDFIDARLADDSTAALGGVAILLLDLDGFKLINDEHGHNTGDQLLCQAAARMQVALRDSDYLARLGGDEFLVVIPQVSEAATAERVAEKLIEAIRQPFMLDHLVVNVTTSIGISLFPQDGRDRESLVKNADIALYEAKRAGRDQARLFATARPA